jgi:lysophospholipid acyltransferase (LPLAT)-like uncharacterized protein
MKIRHPLLIKMAGRLIGWVVRLWIGTVRYRQRTLGPQGDPTVPGLKERYVYAFWHETMLIPAYQYRLVGAATLISEHADGEMIAGACKQLGLGVVRGSTTRGGLRAIREIMGMQNRLHLVITPDGPRGPRRRVQPGVVFLAARTGMPVVPVGFACKKAWRARSWDSFILPRPFTEAVGVIGKPIHVPAEADKQQLELYRQCVEQAMEDVMRMAEEMVQGGNLERRAA